ncbi:uncharacterized protein LOC133389950 [Rhineura floridana]|uniref:uncharacterized protein LOC133389950 n=1 Tax=Rhineura floridana TaxID=261503 RepID=UPI002AC81F3D|nr:uncharacterized protein LOC133389950 [Rhineura floridana]
MVLTRQRCRELVDSQQSQPQLTSQRALQPKITSFFSHELAPSIQEQTRTSAESPNASTPLIMDWSINHFDEYTPLREDSYSTPLNVELAEADLLTRGNSFNCPQSPRPQPSHPSPILSSSLNKSTMNEESVSSLPFASSTGPLLLVLDELNSMKSFFAECNALLKTLTLTAKKLVTNNSPLPVDDTNKLNKKERIKIDDPVIHPAQRKK